MRHTPNLAILGLQWGDEGKGKLTDLITPLYQHAVRYQGGNNAGHTIVVNGKSVALHLIPCGALRPECQLYITNGVVLNIDVLRSEVEKLEDRGLQIRDRLYISDRAHVITPYTIKIDHWRESRAGKNKIGTTGRGIGPTYEAKMARTGIRAGDLKLPKEKLIEKLEALFKACVDLVGSEAHDLQPPQILADELVREAGDLTLCICDTRLLVRRAQKKGESILFEGAQATMLDIDHGTYPFVTSSNCSIGGLLTGTGLNHTVIGKVIGVAKAYTTRVGEGPFPSELTCEIGETIREVGREYGTTTGRKRRCGWFDAAVVRYGCELNGVSEIFLTKLDVLTGIEELKVVIGYQDMDGIALESMPADTDDWKYLTPIIKTCPGWTEDITQVRRFEDLPENAKRYLQIISDALDGAAELGYISVGPDREAGFALMGSLMEELINTAVA